MSFFIFMRTSWELYEEVFQFMRTSWELYEEVFHEDNRKHDRGYN